MRVRSIRVLLYITGSPPPDVIWERKQKNKWIIIEDGNEFKFDIWESQSASNVWVEMVNPGPSDAGRYRCRGVNQFGEDSKTVDVERNIYF